VIKLGDTRYSHYKSFTINNRLILRLVSSYEANRYWCQPIWRILVSCNQSFITFLTRACRLLQRYSSISLFINHNIFLIPRLKLRIYQTKINKISANVKIRHRCSVSADLVTIFICGLFYQSVSNSYYTASSGNWFFIKDKLNGFGRKQSCLNRVALLEFAWREGGKKSLKPSGRIADNEPGVRTRYLLKRSKQRDRYINQSGCNILSYVTSCHVMSCHVMLRSFSCVILRRLNFRADVSERLVPFSFRPIK
jgi:hypothetical protein